MTLELPSLVSLEVAYVFRKVAASLWLLIDVQTYVHCLYFLG